MSFTIAQVLAWQSGSLCYCGSRLGQYADQIQGAFPSGNFDVASSWQSPAAHGFSAATSSLTIGAQQLAQRLRSGAGVCSSGASRMENIQADIKSAQAKAAHAATGQFAGVGLGLGPSGEALIPSFDSFCITVSPDAGEAFHQRILAAQRYQDAAKAVRDASEDIKRALQDAEIFDQELASGLANMVSANFGADVSVNRSVEVLAPKHISGFAKALSFGLHVAPGFAQELAVYEHFTGHDGVTGEAANKTMALAGLIPGAGLGKGALKGLELEGVKVTEQTTLKTGEHAVGGEVRQGAAKEAEELAPVPSATPPPSGKVGKSRGAGGSDPVETPRGTGGPREAVRRPVTSNIDKDTTLVKIAEKSTKSEAVQKDMNDMTQKLGEGNMNPGLGTKALNGTDVSYARSKHGARLFFRQTENGIELVGKSDKNTETQVINLMKQHYGTN